MTYHGIYSAGFNQHQLGSSEIISGNSKQNQAKIGSFKISENEGRDGSHLKGKVK